MFCKKKGRHSTICIIITRFSIYYTPKKLLPCVAIINILVNSTFISDIYIFTNVTQTSDGLRF